MFVSVHMVEFRQGAPLASDPEMQTAFSWLSVDIVGSSGVAAILSQGVDTVPAVVE
jgi:hypothetical protein